MGYEVGARSSVSPLASSMTMRPWGSTKLSSVAPAHVGLQPARLGSQPARLGLQWATGHTEPLTTTTDRAPHVVLLLLLAH